METIMQYIPLAVSAILLGCHLVHGGRRGGPGPVRQLCGHVRI